MIDEKSLLGHPYIESARALSDISLKLYPMTLKLGHSSIHT